ncbi:MAG: HAMP domain-containing histidine kinase [Gammaproteobacteria bacterium]|nr:HAMP domain-containing histidine kinase [Gammaproteobacteria bacterium]
MRLRSLRVRLLVAATVSVSIALVAAGFGLVALFSHHAERQLDGELEIFLTELIGRLEPDDAGGFKLTRPLSDPRFEEPLSGLYWQIQDDKHRLLTRSRSLWDHVLPLAPDELTLGVVHRHELPGPDAQSLLVREQQVIVLPTTQPHRLRVVVAIDRSDLIHARDAFAADLWPYLVLLTAMLLVASWWQVRTGLSPLDRVRRGVQAVRSGEHARLTERFPDEVQPLADEINELLNARDRTVEAARAWTADLAHGLKTPLAALTADAERLRREGTPDIADDLEHLAQTMRQRVDRELIRARLRSEASGRAHHADLVKVLNGVIRTLQRTPAGEALTWQVDVPDSEDVRLPPADLSELLGNLLDNASKWARSTVRVHAAAGEKCVVYIEDDGPGIPEQQRRQIGQRGLRLDELTSGTGLGLAIARDILDAYGGELEFGVATLGGLSVCVHLPGVATASV